MEKIWKGAFAPGFTKGVVAAWFEADASEGGREEDEVVYVRNERNVATSTDFEFSTADPSDVFGTLYVEFHNMGPYAWDHVSYQEFIDFKESGFSTSWLWANLPLSPGR